MGIAPNIKLSVVRASALPPLPGGDMAKIPSFSYAILYQWAKVMLAGISIDVKLGFSPVAGNQ